MAWFNVTGGVFIVIFVGIGLACVTLALEYWWYRSRKPNIAPVPPSHRQLLTKTHLSSKLHDEILKGLPADYAGLQNRRLLQPFGTRYN